MNEYEIECTCKYEGTYTAEEIELNNQLYAECSKETLDGTAIEELLRKGADPLGATAVSGWGLLNHIYGEIVGDSQDNSGVNLLRITELFLRHGMDIDNPRVPYDGDNSLNPVRMFAFIINANALHALEMLLDNGLSASVVNEAWGHIAFDLINLDCGNPNDGGFWTNKCTWAMRLIMFCASYEHVLDNDEDLRHFIGYSYNTYDIHRFRKWDDFYYKFDTSHCDQYMEFYKSVITVFEKQTNQEVWKVGIGLDKNEF